MARSASSASSTSNAAEQLVVEMRTRASASSAARSEVGEAMPRIGSPCGAHVLASDGFVVLAELDAAQTAC